MIPILVTGGCGFIGSALAACAFDAKLAELAKKKEKKKLINYFEEKAKQIDPGAFSAFAG